jgi:hypothetical protein
VHVPGARKSGLGAILADGLEIERGGALVTGGLFTVVVVVGATVVGVTTVVGGGVVVVGLLEPLEFDREFCVGLLARTCDRRASVDLTARWARRGAIVVVVVATVVVVVTTVVVPIPNSVDGETMVAMAGSAVVLRTIPRISDPIDPINTERRGPRRDVENRPLASPERFCPCVMLVMDQLSKINSKVLPTTSQHLLKSVASSRR